MNEITNIPTSVGQYSATTTYQPQDRVYNNGSIFASLAVQKGNEPSLTVNVDGTYDASDGWMLIAVSGTAPAPTPVTPTVDERLTALENGKIGKPTVTGTAGQHLSLKNATTGETEWVDPEESTPITVDSEMSTTSTNPLQNKVISTFWYQLGAKIDQQILALQNLKASLDAEVANRVDGDSALDKKVRDQQTTISQNSTNINLLTTSLNNFRNYVNQMIGTGVVHTKGEEFIDGIKHFADRLLANNGVFIDSVESTLRDSGCTVLFEMDDDGYNGHLQLYGAFDEIRVGGVRRPENDTDAANKEYVDEMVASIPKMERKVVDELPSVGDANTLYLLRNSSVSGTDLYSEYIYIGNSWELLGTASADFSNYYTKSEVNTLNLGAVHKSGTETITGNKTFSGDVDFPNGIHLGGDTILEGHIQTQDDPSSPMDLTNKAYVDSKVSSAISDFSTADLDTIWEEVF